MGMRKIVFVVLCSFLLMVGSGANASIGIGPDSTLVKIKLLAGKGQVLGSAPFGVESKVEDIKKTWGEPDADLYGILIGYKEKNVVFLTMDTRDESTKDYATAVMPIEDEVNGTLLSTLVRDLGDPTHKLVIDEDTMIVCYDTNGHHLQFVLNKDQETDNYRVSSYMVSKEFMQI